MCDVIHNSTGTNINVKAKGKSRWNEMLQCFDHQFLPISCPGMSKPFNGFYVRYIPQLRNGHVLHKNDAQFLIFDKTALIE